MTTTSLHPSADHPLGSLLPRSPGFGCTCPCWLVYSVGESASRRVCSASKKKSPAPKKTSAKPRSHGVGCYRVLSPIPRPRYPSFHFVGHSRTSQPRGPAPRRYRTCCNEVTATLTVAVAKAIRRRVAGCTPQQADRRGTKPGYVRQYVSGGQHDAVQSEIAKVAVGTSQPLTLLYALGGDVSTGCPSRRCEGRLSHLPSGSEAGVRLG